MNVHHDLSDAMKMVDDYHHELEKYFSRLYLDSLESGLMVEHRIKKTASNLQQRATFRMCVRSWAEPVYANG